MNSKSISPKFTVELSNLKSVGNSYMDSKTGEAHKCRSDGSKKKSSKSIDSKRSGFALHNGGKLVTAQPELIHTSYVVDGSQNLKLDQLYFCESDNYKSFHQK